MGLTPKQKEKYEKEWKKPENIKSGEILTPGSIVGGVAKKVATKKLTESLKKSGLEKLAKINRTTNESDISYALRQGKISQKEAAAIDPKKFPLPDKTKTKVIATIDLKTNKITKNK